MARETKEAAAGTVIIRRARQAWGWMGNMARYDVEDDGVVWPTAEALFQALRFDPGPLREQIRAEPDPMKAKVLAKGHVELMVVEQRGPADVENMRRVLRLKVRRHPWMADELLTTAGRPIVEDCTARQHGGGLFWGAALVDGAWQGQNVLGQLWMDLRTGLKAAAGPT